jgi:NTP pyrophosphatase (non-canonical NTP hydrolase)
MELKELQDECYSSSWASGWWDNWDESPSINKNIVGTKLALIHSEISEAMEGYRKNLMDDHLPHRKGVEVELADAIIRILDLAGHLRLDIEGAILEKMEYNAQRADHKPENRAAANGKKF